MSERGWLAAFVVAGVLGLGACAAPKDAPVSGAAHEELRDQSTDAAAAEDDMEAAPAPEPAPKAELEAEAASEEAEAPLRDLADIERELAANQARLRALGVLPGDGEGTTKPTEPPPESKPKGDRPAKPSAQPSKPGKKGKPKKSPDTTGSAGAAPSMRDEAKATGPLPNTGTDAIDRCESICALSQGTCELRVAICELADRHDEEDDYRSACDRAGEDCDVAEEACRACAE